MRFRWGMTGLAAGITLVYVLGLGREVAGHAGPSVATVGVAVTAILAAVSIWADRRYR